jgi:predicted nucleotidyltransferase
MGRTRVRSIPEFREVVYGDDHWRLLKELRIKAREVMEIFVKHGLQVWVHGSIARGDVWEKSDVDVVIPIKTPGLIVEHILEESGFKPFSRYIIAATPTTTPKGIIYLDDEERVSVSFPLFDYKPREVEFYKYSGVLTYSQLLADERVPGVNKNLVLIMPTESGHLEAPVPGYEDYVAKVLGVSVDIVRERVEVLTRRDQVGRTGIFAKIALAPGESFEEAIERLLREKPLIRRTINN